MYVGQMILLTT
jgi:hypothetical protein